MSTALNITSTSFDSLKRAFEGVKILQANDFSDVSWTKTFRIQTNLVKSQHSSSNTLSFTESSRNSCQTRAKFDFTLQRHRTVMKLNWKRGQFSWKVSLHYISRSRKTQWRRNWGLWTEPKQNITKFKNSNALFKRQLHNAFLLELKSKSIYLPWNYFQMISCFFGCLALINKGQCAGVFPKKRHSSIIWIYLRQHNI